MSWGTVAAIGTTVVAVIEFIRFIFWIGDRKIKKLEHDLEVQKQLKIEALAKVEDRDSHIDALEFKISNLVNQLDDLRKPTTRPVQLNDQQLIVLKTLDEIKIRANTGGSSYFKSISEILATNRSELISEDLEHNLNALSAVNLVVKSKRGNYWISDVGIAFLRLYPDGRGEI